MHTREPANYIQGRWLPIPGNQLVSTSPADPGQVVFSGSPHIDHATAAVAAARRSAQWWGELDRNVRFEVLRRYAQIVAQRAPILADLICLEVGKAMWESKAEAGLLAGKVQITLDPDAGNNGLARVSDFSFSLGGSRTARCAFAPHGVMAVIGPFNFPAHLANGHIVPALAMGNTVVFKPSDKAPAVGQEMAACFVDALAEVLGPDATHPDRGAGVINLVHGAAPVAERLVVNPDVDAIAFTGSWSVARRIAQASIDMPGRMLAFELGGSNPAVVMDDADLPLAAMEVARSAFATTGQRCTCTRRLIVHEAVANRLVNAIASIAQLLVIDHPAGSPVFCGPLITEHARQTVLNFQSRAVAAGAKPILSSQPLDRRGGGWYISPGILQVDHFTPEPISDARPLDPGCDVEVFGPLLRVATVRSFDQAVQQANASRFGLAAAIFTHDSRASDLFLRRCRAGCINVNTGTAGASSKLPFGGLGQSGNHRPAGSFALDYCAYPVASMIETSPATPAPSEGMSFDPSWIK